MKNKLLIILFLLFIFLLYSDNTSDNKLKKSKSIEEKFLDQKYIESPILFYKKVIENPEKYKDKITYIIDKGYKLLDSKTETTNEELARREYFYRALAKLYPYMTKKDINYAEVVVINFYNYEIEGNYNVGTVPDLIILLSLLGTKNCTEYLRRLLFYPAIRKWEAEQYNSYVIEAFIDSVYIFLENGRDDKYSINYLKDLFEFSKSWNNIDRDKLHKKINNYLPLIKEVFEE